MVAPAVYVVVTLNADSLRRSGCTSKGGSYSEVTQQNPGDHGKAPPHVYTFARPLERSMKHGDAMGMAIAGMVREVYEDFDCTFQNDMKNLCLAWGDE